MSPYCEIFLQAWVGIRDSVGLLTNGCLGILTLLAEFILKCYII